MKKLLLVLMVLWLATPAWAQRPTPIVTGGSTSLGEYNPPLRVSSTGVLYISLMGSATTPIQRPTPTVIGGADSNGLPIAFLTDSDGTLRVSCSDCGGGGGGDISGTIADTQLAFGTAADTIGGEAGLTYNSGTDSLTAVGGVTAATGTFTTSNTSPLGVFATSITSPIHYGGTAAGSTLTLVSTSGVGSGDSILFKGGTNGGTTWGTMVAAGYTSTIPYTGTTGTFSGVVAANGGITSTFDDPFSALLTTSGAHTITFASSNSGTTSLARLQISNNAGSTNDALTIRTSGTGFITAGIQIMDGASITTGANLAGGLTVGTVANATLGIYTQNALRYTITGAGVLTFDTSMVTSAASGNRYLCISTTGVVTSATVCTGT